MLTLMVNGEPRTAHDGLSLADLVTQMELDPRQIAVERNRAVVPRTRYQDTALADGDQLEIVTFVGGG